MRIDPKDINKILLPRLLTLITCDDGIGGIDAIPCDTIIPVSSNPSIVIVTINPSYKIFTNILNRKDFVINILPKEYLNKILSCFKNFPRGINKLEQVGLSYYSSEKVESKRVKEAKVWIECKLSDKIKVGGNMLIFAEVVTIEVDESIVTGDKIDLNKLNPPIRISESEFSDFKKLIS
jgi:flavin reductase (DIM6/NTAB) family NADH-FMN oxidoreductase RutF